MLIGIIWQRSIKYIIWNDNQFQKDDRRDIELKKRLSNALYRKWFQVVWANKVYNWQCLFIAQTVTACLKILLSKFTGMCIMLSGEIKSFTLIFKSNKKLVHANHTGSFLVWYNIYVYMREMTACISSYMTMHASAMTRINIEMRNQHVLHVCYGAKYFGALPCYNLNWYTVIIDYTVQWNWNSQLTSSSFCLTDFTSFLCRTHLLRRHMW